MRRSKLGHPLCFLALHVAAGFAVAALFVAGLILLGGGALGDLLWNVGGIGAVARLWAGCGLTFGAALFASGIMSRGREDGRRGAGQEVLAPATRLAARPVRPK